MDLTKYQTALNSDPRDPAALRALGEQAAKEGRWQELVDYLQREAEVCEHPGEKADLLLQKARVRHEKLGSAEEALQDVRAALSANPFMRAARETEWQLLIELGRWQELAASLEAEANSVAAGGNSRHAAALHMVRAEVCEFRLNDPEGAEKACAQALATGAIRLAHVPPLEIQCKQGKWTEFAETLQAMESSSSTFEEKAAWGNLRAHLLECRLGKPDEADKILDEFIESTPTEVIPNWAPGAVLARSEMAFSRGNDPDLADTYSLLLNLLESDQEQTPAPWRAALMYRVGEISEAIAGNVAAGSGTAAALEKYRGAHQRVPEDPRPLRAMIRLQRSGNQEDLLKSRLALTKIETGPALGSIYHLAMGRTQELGLKRVEEALGSYRKARQLAPSWHLLEYEAEATRRLWLWNELTGLRAEQADQAADVKLKAALLYERAQILQHRLDQPDNAAEAYRQALTVPATALGMVRSLAQCYSDQGDMENLARTLMGQERLVSDSVYLVHLGLRAGDLWLRLTREDEAFKALSAVVQRESHNLEALLTLEEICYAQKSLQNLYGIQQRILEAIDPNTDASYRRAVQLDNAALLLRGLSNEQAALAVLQQALDSAPARVPPLASQAVPQDSAALMELRTLAYRGGRWDEYFNLIKAEADAAGRNSALLWRAAMAAWGRLNKIPEATELLKEIAAKGCHSVTLLEAKKYLEFLADAWMPWLTTAAELSQLLDDAGRVMLFFEMGRVHRYRLRSLDTAAECYDRMVELEPDNFVAHESLCLLNIERKGLEGLRKFHSTMVALETDPAARAAFAFSRADVAWRNDLLAEAETDWRAVLKDKPDDLSALRRLERLYDQTKNVQGHIEALRREIKLRKEARVIVLLLMRQGELWDGVKRAEEAIVCYRDVLTHSPEELDALEALTRLYRQENKWKELAENLDHHARVAAQPEVKIGLYAERAKVCEEQLHDVRLAIASHLAALEVNPKHIPSLGELERLYEITESWEDELGILKRLLDLAGPPAEQHRIHFKMGTIYESKMVAPSAAISAYVKAHDLEPTHLKTLDALERLYDQMGDAARLVAILEEKATLLPDERVRLYMWIGRLWDEKLADPGKAIASYERIPPIDSKNLDAISDLESLYQRTNQWENVIRAVIMKAEAVPDQAAAVELLNRAGGLWVEKFNNDEQALQALSKALTINPRHRPTIAKAQEIYARLGRWEEVLSLYAREVELVADPKAKSDIFTRMGQVLQEKIGNDARASQNYELALRSDPNRMEAVRPLARIYFNHKRWEQAEPLYRKWGDSLGAEAPPQSVAQVFYERGSVCQNLSRDREALDFYRRAIEKMPGYLDPLRARSELHVQRKEWNDALEAEKEVIAALEKQGDKAGVGNSLVNMGGLAEKIGKPEEAARYYTRSLEMTGDYAPTLENLIRLFSEKNLFNNVVGLYDRLIALNQSTPHEANIRLRKGVVLEDKINDKQRALNEYNRAIEIAPENTDALHRQAGVFIKIFKWEEAAAAANKLLSLEKEPSRQADCYCLLGRIEQDGRKNLQAARSAYDKALQIQPTHLGAMDAIGTILEAMEDWNGYVQTFEKFLKNIPSSLLERVRDIHLRLGQVQRDKLKNRDRAIIEFNNAIKADAECQPAHAALAKLYLMEKTTYPQAIRENNLLLKSNALTVEAYQDMSKIFEEQKEIDRAFCVHSIIDLFGALGKWDKTNYEARLEHLPASSTKTVDDETRERALIHPMARHPATTLLEGLGAALCKIFPTGGHPGSVAPANHSVRKKATEIAANLVVETYEIYMDEGARPGVSWYPGPTPAFVINPLLFDKASERGKRFLVGRGLEGVKNGLASIWGLNVAEVLKRLQLVVKLFKPEFVVAGVNEKDAQTYIKSLKKEVPRKVRKAIEEAAAAHQTQEKQFSFDSWRTGLIHSANRGGLVVSGHPGEAALALLILEERIKPGETANLQAMQNCEQLAELLHFAVSDLHFVTRKRAAFSLY